VILEAVRLVAAWLGDATHGVGAQLAGMDFDGSDPTPPTPTIVDETTNDAAAQGRPAESADGPVLSVVAFPLDDGSNATVKPGRDVTVRVAVLYAHRNSNPARGRQDALYTLRAVQLSLRALSLESSDAQRIRGPVALVDLSELRVEPGIPDPQLVDNAIYGQVVAGWMATDLLT
jgi:hypothetical protein